MLRAVADRRGADVGAVAGGTVVASGVGDEARYGLLAPSSGSGGRIVDSFAVGDDVLVGGFVERGVGAVLCGDGRVVVEGVGRRGHGLEDGDSCLRLC